MSQAKTTESLVVEFDKIREARYESPKEVALDKRLFEKGIEALASIEESCIWCKYPKLCGQLLRLLGFPDNPLKAIFLQRCRDSLSACVECLEAYYTWRPDLDSDFVKLFEPHTLPLLWERVDVFDQSRLQAVFKDFLEDKIDSKSPVLLLALYEVFSFPAHFRDVALKDLFRQSMLKLHSKRNLIKLNKVLPGILVCLFDQTPEISNWARSILNGSSTEPATHFLPGAFKLAELINPLDFSQLRDNFLLLFKSLPRQVVVNELDFLWSYFLSKLESDVSNPLALNALSWIHISFMEETKSFLGLVPERHSNLESVMKILDSDVSDDTVALSAAMFVHSSSSTGLSRRIEELIRQLPEVVLKAKKTDIAIRITRFILELIRNPVCLMSLKNVVKSSYRLFSILHEKLAGGPAMSEFARCVFRLDMISVDCGDEFRGHCQLIMKILTTDSSFWLPYADELSSLADSAFRYISSRSLIFNSVCSSFPSTLVPQSPHSCFAFLLAAVSIDQLPSSKILEVFSSFPEEFAKGLQKLVNLVSGLQKADRSPRLCDNLVALMDETLQKAYFLDDGKTIVDLFPGFGDIHLTFIHSTLTATSILSDDNHYSTLLMDVFTFNGKLLNLLPPSIFPKAFASVTSSHINETIDIVLRFISENKMIPPLTVYNALLTATLWLTYSKHRLSSSHQKHLVKIYDCIDFTSSQRQSLTFYLSEYERKLKCLAPKPAQKSQSSVARLESPVSNKSRDFIDLSLEEKILEDLNSAENKRRERSLPQSLRSSAIPIVAKPGSLVSQIRQETAKEVAALSGTSISRKRPVPNALRPPTKPAKIDIFASSASDSDHDTDLKEKFSKTADVAEPSRSVKLIDIAGSSNDLKRPGGSAKAENTYVSPDVNIIKKFHQNILSFTLADIEILPDNNSVAPVPNSFESPEHYISVFEPLLYIECRAQLISSMEETAADPTQSLRISGVAKVDQFHEVSLQSDASGENDQVRISDQDYLLVSFKSSEEPIPGIVVQSSMKLGTLEATVRLLVPDAKASVQIELREGLKMTFKKIGNVITNIREYQAMMSIGSISLCKHILKPTLNISDIDSSASEVTNLCRTLNINASQAKAILTVVKNVNPITLIQGPPGTGKTKTIESLLSLLFIRSATGVLSRPNGSKVLICAPSNAAIDEIVRRIRYGLVDRISGNRLPIKVLRVGSLDMIADDIKDLTVDNQVERMMNNSGGASSALLETQRKKCDELRRSLQSAERRNDASEIKTLKTSLWEAREAMRKNQKFIEDTKNTIRQKILNDAQIVCCTLSSSGHELIARLGFDIVIIDEACQAVELSCLVPMMHNCRQCVLVGGTVMLYNAFIA